MKKVKNMKYLLLSKTYALIAGLLFTHISCAQNIGNLQENELSIKGIYDEYYHLGQYSGKSYCPHELSVWMAGNIYTLNYYRR